MAFNAFDGFFKGYRHFTGGFRFLKLSNSPQVFKFFEELLVLFDGNDNGDFFAFFVCEKLCWFFHVFAFTKVYFNELEPARKEMLAITEIVMA